MGFFPRLFGRTEFDTTVSDFQAEVDDGGPFRMVVTDVFTITGRGAVVMGRPERGIVRVGDAVALRHPDSRTATATVSGIETFGKTVTQAGPGQDVGVLFAELTRDDFVRGTVIEGS